MNIGDRVIIASRDPSGRAGWEGVVKSTNPLRVLVDGLPSNHPTKTWMFLREEVVQPVPSGVRKEEATTWKEFIRITTVDPRKEVKRA